MYRKFTADHIFDGYKIINRPAVLITDEKGTIEELVDPVDAGEGIEQLEGLLSPGFVNAHCHLELSHMKGTIAEGTGLVQFVQQVMGNRTASSEKIQSAMAEAAAEMYQSGTVAISDICNTADSIAVKQESPLHWHNFVEVSGFVDAVAGARLANMRKVYEVFIEMGVPGKTGLSPHAPYSVSKTLFRLLDAATADQLITIHNQECDAENELYLQKKGGFLQLYENFGIDAQSFEPTGKTALKSWLPYFSRQQSIISVHNTSISADDLLFAQQHLAGGSSSIYYCICINANLYIERRLPPINMLREHNATIVLGTDSYASNHQLNILEEIKKIQERTKYAIPLAEILTWATSNGARALELNTVVGSFEKGKKPGVVLIEHLDNLQTSPQSVSRRII